MAHAIRLSSLLIAAAMATELCFGHPRLTVDNGQNSADEREIRRYLHHEGWRIMICIRPTIDSLSPKCLSAFELLRSAPILNETLMERMVESLLKLDSRNLGERLKSIEEQLRENHDLGSVDLDGNGTTDLTMTFSTHSLPLRSNKAKTIESHGPDDVLENILGVIYTSDEVFRRTYGQYVESMQGCTQRNSGKRGNVNPISTVSTYAETTEEPQSSDSGSMDRATSKAWRTVKEAIGKVWYSIEKAIGKEDDDYQDNKGGNSAIGQRGDCLEDVNCSGFSCHKASFTRALFNELWSEGYHGCNKNATPHPDDVSSRCYNVINGKPIEERDIGILFDQFCRWRAALYSQVDEQDPCGSLTNSIAVLKRLEQKRSNVCSNPRAICLPEAESNSNSRSGFALDGANPIPLTLVFDLAQMEASILEKASRDPRLSK